jgi:hypothetical protein
MVRAQGPARAAAWPTSCFVITTVEPTDGRFAAAPAVVRPVLHATTATMLHAVILICALGRPCTPDSATDLIRTPVMSALPTICFMQGQAFLAQTEIGRSLEPNQQILISCQRDK